MKLPLSIEVLGATQEELKALGQKLPKAGNLSMKPQKDSLLFWKWKGFEVVGLEMPDNTNPKSDYWNLDDSTRKSFSELIQAFRKECPRIFSLYSSMGGELPKRESELQMPELLEMITDGRIGNRVLYRVRDLPPKIVEDAAPEAEPEK